MASIVEHQGKLIRINAEQTSLEYSTTGTTWTRLTVSSEFGKINDLLSDNLHLFAACDRGIFYSGNGGYTWTMRAASTSYGKFIGLGGNYKQLFCNTNNGFYSSSNGGYTWTLKH